MHHAQELWLLQSMAHPHGVPFQAPPCPAPSLSLCGRGQILHPSPPQPKNLGTSESMSKEVQATVQSAFKFISNHFPLADERQS